MPIQAPQYPAPIAPSFQSFAERQRMEIDDAIAAAEAQKERQLRVGMAGGKAVYEYDKVLRGYMEAKYANPELKYWDYMKNPTIAGVYRTAGREKIGKHIKAGGDIKDIPGMSFFERQRAGLKGFFEKDVPPAAAAPAAALAQDPSAQAAAQKELELLTGSVAGIDPTAKPSRGSLAEAQREISIEAGKVKFFPELKGLKTAAEVSPGAMGYGPAESAAYEAKPDAKYYDVDPELVGARKTLTSGTAEMVGAERKAQEGIAQVMGSQEKSAAQSGDKLLAWQLRRNKVDVSREEATRLINLGHNIGERKIDELAEADIGPPTTKTTTKVTRTEMGADVRAGKLYSRGTLSNPQGNYLGDVGAGGRPIYQNIVNLQKKGEGGKDLVNYQQIFKFTDPEGTDSYYRMAGVAGNNEVQADNPRRFIADAGGGFNQKTVAMQKKLGFDDLTKVDIDPSVIEAAGGEKAYFKSEEFKKAFPMPEVTGEAAGEAAKGGLKKVLGGLGSAYSIGTGLSKMQSKDETTRLGGGLQVAGGAAGLVAMTNFWNPVGWAAMIPAALSIGGGLMGGGGSDPLAKTPLGRYRRRVGIG